MSKKNNKKNNVKNNVKKQRNNINKSNVPVADYHIVSELTEGDFLSANEFIFEQTETFKFWRWGLMIALPLIAFIMLMIGVVLKLNTPYVMTSSVIGFASIIVAFCAKPLILLFYNLFSEKKYPKSTAVEYKFYDGFMTAKIDNKTTTIKYNTLRKPIRESYSYVFFEDSKNDFIGFLPKYAFEDLAQVDEIKEYIGRKNKY